MNENYLSCFLTYRPTIVFVNLVDIGVPIGDIFYSYGNFVYRSYRIMKGLQANELILRAKHVNKKFQQSLKIHMLF